MSELITLYQLHFYGTKKQVCKGKRLKANLYRPFGFGETGAKDGEELIVVLKL